MIVCMKKKRTRKKKKRRRKIKKEGEREREEFAFCFVDCQVLKDRTRVKEREKRRLVYENIHSFDRLKKYVYVLVNVSYFCLYPQNVVDAM